MKNPFDLIREKRKSRIDNLGAEIPDETPVAIPVNLRRQETMDDRIRRIIAHSLSIEAQRQGMESFDDADDFDIDDDPIDPTTPWEEDHDLAATIAVKHDVVQEPTMDPDRRVEILNRFVKKKSTPPEKPSEAPTEAETK